MLRNLRILRIRLLINKGWMNTNVLKITSRVSSVEHECLHKKAVHPIVYEIFQPGQLTYIMMDNIYPL